MDRSVDLIESEDLIVRTATSDQLPTAQIGDDGEPAEAEAVRHPLAVLVPAQKDEVALPGVVPRRSRNEGATVSDCAAQLHELYRRSERPFDDSFDLERGHRHDPLPAKLGVRLDRRGDHDPLCALR